MLDVCGCQHGIATPIADVDQTQTVHKKTMRKTNQLVSTVRTTKDFSPPSQDDAETVIPIPSMIFYRSLTRGFQKFVSAG